MPKIYDETPMPMNKRDAAVPTCNAVYVSREDGTPECRCGNPTCRKLLLTYTAETEGRLDVVCYRCKYLNIVLLGDAEAG
jgi:phage FluMu protein Com